MDIAEVRAANLKRLIKEEFGTVAKFAEKMGMKPDYVSRWYSKSSKHHRNMSRATARKIEEVVGKPSAWLDAPVHLDVGAPTQLVGYGRVDVALLERVIRLVEEVEREVKKQKSPAAKAAIIAQGYEQQAVEAYQTDREKIRRIVLSVTDQ